MANNYNFMTPSNLSFKIGPNLKLNEVHCQKNSQINVTSVGSKKIAILQSNFQFKGFSF